MNRSDPIIIYGAGGFAREVAWLAQSCGVEVAAFVDDDEANHGSALNGIRVLALEDARSQFAGAGIVAAIGSPQTRTHLMTRAINAGFHPVSLIHPTVQRSQWVTMGEGAVICAGNTLTTNIVLGENVQINLHCTIGHDVVLGDFATLAPGVHISGWVHIGQRVYIGTGAVFINGAEGKPITVGDDAVIGAGACVTRSVEAGTTVVGVPAKPITR